MKWQNRDIEDDGKVLYFKQKSFKQKYCLQILYKKIKRLYFHVEPVENECAIYYLYKK